MPDVLYSGKQYRLRAGSPMPISTAGTFVLHTFMAEVTDVDIYACKSDLPGSEEFRGQGGTYMSASFSRLNVRGGEIFSGKIIHSPDYVDEDDMNDD